MMADTKKCEIDVEIKRTYNDSILVNDGENDVWLPFSQVEAEEEIKPGATCTITIPEWLAIDRDLV